VSYTEYRAHLRPRLRNVIGVVRGGDRALAPEAIVVGGHYDHLGMGGRFSDAPESTGITHNGADDNASGTAAVIELCRAAARRRPRLARTLVCAAFAGEEVGLLGSAYYAAHAPVPLEQTRAMVNLDMVGRARGHVMVGLFGAKDWMRDLRVEMKAWTRLSVDDFSHGGYEAADSDGASFAEHGVPAIAFFTGFHADYHRPGDDWQKIDAEGGARITELALRLVERLAQ
jgi:Zn-dependent M28 family amino/carboxypeptidase